MADRVQYIMDRMAPTFRMLIDNEVFTSEEVHRIVKKRTEHEYVLRRMQQTPSDYYNYLQYELNLNKLRHLRFLRMGLGRTSKEKKTLARSLKSKFVHHIRYIFERAVRRFPKELSLWTDFISFLSSHKYTALLSSVFGKVLSLFPKNEDLWIQAAIHELKVNKNAHATRILLQRALRANKSSRKLWLHYFQMELWYLMRNDERKIILGISDDADNKLCKSNAIEKFINSPPMIVFRHASAAIPDAEFAFDFHKICVQASPEMKHLLESKLLEQYQQFPSFWTHLCETRVVEAWQNNEDDILQKRDIDETSVKINSIIHYIKNPINACMRVLEQAREALQALEPADDHRHDMCITNSTRGRVKAPNHWSIDLLRSLVSTLQRVCQSLGSPGISTDSADMTPEDRADMEETLLSAQSLLSELYSIFKKSDCHSHSHSHAVTLSADVIANIPVEVISCSLYFHILYNIINILNPENPVIHLDTIGVNSVVSAPTSIKTQTSDTITIGDWLRSRGDGMMSQLTGGLSVHSIIEDVQQWNQLMNELVSSSLHSYTVVDCVTSESNTALAEVTTVNDVLYCHIDELIQTAELLIKYPLLIVLSDYTAKKLSYAMDTLLHLITHPTICSRSTVKSTDKSKYTPILVNKIDYDIVLSVQRIIKCSFSPVSARSYWCLQYIKAVMVCNENTIGSLNESIKFQSDDMKRFQTQNLLSNDASLHTLSRVRIGYLWIEEVLRTHPHVTVGLDLNEMFQFLIIVELQHLRSLHNNKTLTCKDSYLIELLETAVTYCPSCDVCWEGMEEAYRLYGDHKTANHTLWRKKNATSRS